MGGVYGERERKRGREREREKKKKKKRRKKVNAPFSHSLVALMLLCLTSHNYQPPPTGAADYVVRSVFVCVSVCNQIW